MSFWVRVADKRCDESDIIFFSSAHESISKGVFAGKALTIRQTKGGDATDENIDAPA